MLISQLRGVVDKLKEMVRLIEGSMRKAKDVANALEDSNEDDPVGCFPARPPLS